MIFLVVFKMFLFGNAGWEQQYIDEEEAWQKYKFVSKNLRDGQDVALVVVEHDSVHMLAAAMK